MHICNAQNCRFRRLPRFANLVDLNSIFEQSLHCTPFRKDFTLHIIKKNIFLEGGSTNFLWRPSLRYHSADRISSSPACFAPPDDVLRCRFRSRLTGGTYSLSRLTVADLGSPARDEPWLVRLCQTPVVGMTFWQNTGLMLNAGAVEIVKVFRDRTQRCCCCSFCSLHRFVLLQCLCSRWCTVLKDICFMVVLVVSFANRSLCGNAEEDGLLNILRIR